MQLFSPYSTYLVCKSFPIVIQNKSIFKHKRVVIFEFEIRRDTLRKIPKIANLSQLARQNFNQKVNVSM